MLQGLWDAPDLAYGQEPDEYKDCCMLDLFISGQAQDEITYELLKEEDFETAYRLALNFEGSKDC